jgi:protein-arginine kinase activator protein McsA
MLCEKCEREEATVFYCVAAVKESRHLCETCASTKQQQSGRRIECGWISDSQGTRFVWQEIDDDREV